VIYFLPVCQILSLSDSVCDLSAVSDSVSALSVFKGVFSSFFDGVSAPSVSIGVSACLLV
jgi:hypothetical protein